MSHEAVELTGRITLSVTVSAKIGGKRPLIAGKMHARQREMTNHDEHSPSHGGSEIFWRERGRRRRRRRRRRSKEQRVIGRLAVSTLILVA